MIDPDKRKAVYLLHTEGMAVREICRRLNLSRNTVRRIIKQKGVVAVSPRKDKIHIDQELLERLYDDCEHWAQRVHEKLLEEEGLEFDHRGHIPVKGKGEMEMYFVRERIVPELELA